MTRANKSRLERRTVTEVIRPIDMLLPQLVALLADARRERQIAAMIVCAELKLDIPEVVAPLTHFLAVDDLDVQRYALEALTQLGAKDIALQVMPLLDSKHAELRTMARRFLLDQGTDISAILMREMAQAPLARKREMVSLLVHDHRKASLKRAVSLMQDRDLAETVMLALQRERDAMTHQEQKVLRELLLERLNDAHQETGPMVCTLRLLGLDDDPELVEHIFPIVESSSSLEVRVAAINAARRALLAKELKASIAQKLLAVLVGAKEHDAALARAIIPLLRGANVSRTKESLWGQLSNSPVVEIRRFALEMLGKQGAEDGASTEILLERLLSDDLTSRDAAEKALRQTEGIGPLIAQRLIRDREIPAHVDRLIRLLIPHVGELKPALRTNVIESTVTMLEEERPNSATWIKLAKALDVKLFGAAMNERIKTHRRSKQRHEQAARLLSALDELELMTDDQRYGTFIDGLKALSEAKELARANRTTHPVLKHGVSLIASGFPLVARLKKEKQLDSESLFYLGFNLVESDSQDEFDIGVECLRHLAETSPRSALGKSAKNKLRLVGEEA